MLDPFLTAVEAEKYLSNIGNISDYNLDVFEIAMAFGLIDYCDADIEKYRTHIKQISVDLSKYYKHISKQEKEGNAELMASALRHIMESSCGYYVGDNNNVLRMIDDRCGSSVASSIMAVSLCRNQGWAAYGVDFPSNFLIRLEKEGTRLIIDPAQSFKILEAKDIRNILKKTMGDKAELSSDYFNICTDLNMLMRLQNNIKYKFIDDKKYHEALKIIFKMSLIASNDYRINLDKAVLFERIGDIKSAIENITIYIDKVGDVNDKIEAEKFLYQLQSDI